MNCIMVLISTDRAIIAAARLSQRYITDRQLPDKAIDLIDEAGSRFVWKWTPSLKNWTNWKGGLSS